MLVSKGVAYLPGPYIICLVDTAFLLILTAKLAYFATITIL